MGMIGEVASGRGAFSERAGILTYGRWHVAVSLLTGIPLLLLTLLIVLVTVTLPSGGSSTGFLAIAVILAVFGPLLWFLFRLMRKGLRGVARSKLIKRYLSLIVNEGHLSVDDLVALTNRSREDVTVDLKDLQRLGFLPHFSLDARSHTLDREVAEVTAETLAIPEVSFTCRSCGANNSVRTPPGHVAKCDYCGSARVGI